MKKVIFIILFFLTAAFSYGQETIDKKSVFEQSEKAIVQISIAIKIDSAKIKNKDLFKKLETELKTKLLDNFYYSSLGSGFFITKDGYLISNHHVIQHMPKKECQDRIENKLIDDIGKKLIPGVLTVNEINKIFMEFKAIMKTGEFKYIVQAVDDELYELEIIKDNQEDDLSLLKINGKSAFTILPLYKNGTVKTGEEVFALGYPLQSTLDRFLKERKTTFTSGVVSAVRDDKWGIQHTASINPGNSGGPLLNKNHEVVGVNVGTVTDANSLFFSIPATKLLAWLKNVGFDKIIN